MGEAAKKEEEEMLVPVGPGADGLKDAEPQAAEEEPEDKRLGDAEADELEPEKAQGARRKESAKERRERAKKSRDRERLEYNFLLKRNEDLEKRLMALDRRTEQTETVAIDQRITNVQAQLSNADRVIADALRKPNGAGAEEFVEAQRIRDELRDQLGELKRNAQQRQQTQQQARAEPAPQQQQPDPRVLRNARDWASQHEWFDFNGQDEESVIVRAIDESLAAEGFDPASADYWDELTERVKHRLPERFKGARARAEDEDADMEEEKPRPKVGPKFSSGGRERPLKKGEVYVSAERKAAMQQYGVWDDPVARNRMLKKYQEWDAQVASNRS